MNVEYKDFIGIFEDVYPEGFCEYVIKEFERIKETGAGWNRQNTEGVSRLHKADHALNILNHAAPNFGEDRMEDVFFGGLQKCFESYSETFSQLKNVEVRGTYMKVQKTCPAEGYHVWHSERAHGRDKERVLVYNLYLNDIKDEDGGETEFLYQKLRVSPKKNTVVIWPADFTHVHRGNPPLGKEDKYIATGWFYYE
jgi:Rps23 Pro-64 3,4-dihydroxylase Tpa1-like proline 4-hydroxylase